MIAENEIFEYLTFGATFRRALRLFRDQFGLFMKLSAVFAVPYLVLNITLAIDLNRFLDKEPEYFQIKNFVVYGVELLLYELAIVIGHGAISIAVAEIYTGRQPQWLPCLKQAWSKKFSLIGSSLMVAGSAFAIYVLMIVSQLVVIGNGSKSLLRIMFSFAMAVLSMVLLFWWLTGLALTSPAIVIEKFGPVRGMKRSWELSTSSKCYVWSVMTIFSIVMFFIGFLEGAIASAFMDAAIAQILNSLTVILFLPMRSILVTVLYLNLRVGKESMNQEVLLGDLVKDEIPSSSFQTDNAEESIDYRHVPLIDEDENEFSETKGTALSTTMV